MAHYYAFETDRGELVQVSSNGLRSGPEGAMLAGREGDPGLIYFRSFMRFGSAAPRLRDFTTCCSSASACAKERACCSRYRRAAEQARIGLPA